MPIYEYQCQKCQHLFTELRQYSERHNPLNCPVCHTKEVQYVISNCNKLNQMGTMKPYFSTSSPVSKQN